MHRTFSEYLSTVLPGKIRKIAVNAGLECPNRDGSVGTGGCIFCNNAAFNPSYAFEADGNISRQLEKGIEFSRNKGEADGYLAYFQTYSNTYGQTAKLITLYEEALAYPGVVGLVVATRPDCIGGDLLDWMEKRFGNSAPAGHPYLLLEIGIESTRDETLKAINRGHDFACAQKAVRDVSARGIAVGVHLILGLPGETEEDFIMHARRISELPVTVLKLHQLQIIKETKLAEMYENDPQCVRLMTAGEYAATVKKFIAELRDDIVLDRFVSETPKDLLVAPSWGLKPAEFEKMVRE